MEALCLSDYWSLKEVFYRRLEMSELDIAVLRFKTAFRQQQKTGSVKEAWLRMSLTSTQKRQKAGKEATYVSDKR